MMYQRITRLTGRIFCLFLLAAGFLFGPASALGWGAVRAFVGCVTLDRASNLVTAHFGYENSTPADIVYIPGAEENFFVPAPSARPSQPHIFKPGIHHDVFSVVFPADSKLIWFVEGQQIVAGLGQNAACPNVFASPQAFTIPRTGVLTISDSHATPNGVILVQYVNAPVVVLPASVIKVTDGQFTVRGWPGGQIRFVIYYH